MPIDPTRPSSDFTTYTRERADIIKRGTLDFSSSLFKSAVFASTFSPEPIPDSATILTYDTDQGSRFDWDGATFIKDANSVGYSYSAVITSTETQVPNNGSLIGVRIGNVVEYIGEDAFSNCTSLTSITIPNSVRSIGDAAFYNCTALTSITIPNSVRSIGYAAFSNCTALTSITIPNSVTSIGYYAFSNCTSLTSITIPNSVTSIGYYAFYNCTALTSITIPNSVKSIGNSAFSQSGLATVYIASDNPLGIPSPSGQRNVSFYEATVTTILPTTTGPTGPTGETGETGTTGPTGEAG